MEKKMIKHNLLLHGGTKLCAGILLVATLFSSQNVFAVECRLSIVLDRTGSMGTGSDPIGKCSIARDFAIGVVQGFINGDDVSIVPGDPADPTVPLINPDFYDSCLPGERRVEIVTVSEATGGNDDPDNYTSGFVDPAVALIQLQALEATDNASTSSCTGSTQLADALCVAAGNLRAETSVFTDIRRMKIITDGGENSSHNDITTNCDAGGGLTNLDPGYESAWIANSTNELLLGGAAIQIDAILFTDLFFSSAAPGGGGNPADEVPGSGKLSTAEQNFLATIALNTGGSVNLLAEPADAAGSFTTPGGIDLCAGDFDKDFDVDNLDALRFVQDFNDASCQISP